MGTRLFIASIPSRQAEKASSLWGAAAATATATSPDLECSNPMAEKHLRFWMRPLQLSFDAGHLRLRHGTVGLVLQPVHGMPLVVVADDSTKRASPPSVSRRMVARSAPGSIGSSARKGTEP